MMRFKSNLQLDSFQGRLHYTGLEFDFEGFETLDAPRQTAPLVISRTLSLEFNVATGRILYLWGYSPKETWSKKDVPPPQAVRGAVFVELDGRKPQPGVGIDVDTLYDAKEVFDPKTGWILIGSNEGVPEEVVEIATGILLGLHKGDLVAIWLRLS
jgi:hypothetical protein